ncbi:VanZ family protein [Agromyces sp. NPDC004153]
MNRRPLRFVALAYAALVLWATVGPTPWRTSSGSQLDGGILNPESWTATTTWTTGYLSEMAFNVALFIPVGVLAALLIPRRRWALALLAGLAFTTVIELIQVPEPHRISDPRDLVMNTAGAVFGVLLVLAGRMVRRSARVAAALPVPAIESLPDVVADPSMSVGATERTESTVLLATGDRAA